MKRLCTLSIALASFCALFAQERENIYNRTVSLQIENDYGFSDRYYTNALKLNYTEEGDDWWASAAQFAILKLFDYGPRTQYYQSASLGQDMYVGYDIRDPNPPLDDRPYAGWLYLSSGAHIATKNTLDSLTVSLGIVGPQSYAEDVQKAYHSIIDSDRPMGWHNQIKNEPGIIIAYNHSQRIYDLEIAEGFRTDFIGSLGANLGNVSSEGRIKALWRIGFNMPYYFDATRIDAAASQDVEWKSTSREDWHLYLYAGGLARFVGYDITLDGNTFADSRSVAKKWLVGESNVGISARYKMVELSLNWTVRTQDFNTQRSGPHIFWSTALKVSF
jgi:hypothetical protein